MSTLRERLGLLAARLKLRRCARLGPGVRVRGRVWVHGRGRVFIGAGVTLDGCEAPIELHAQGAAAEIHLGSGVLVCGGASIEAVQRVDIGARCRLGPFCKVLDSHFHPLQGNRHVPTGAVPVRLEADVEVGARAILLPGTRLERGVRVCPESVVSRAVPADTVVAGVPAVRVRPAGRSP